MTPFCLAHWFSTNVKHIILANLFHKVKMPHIAPKESIPFFTKYSHMKTPPSKNHMNSHTNPHSPSETYLLLMDSSIDYRSWIQTNYNKKTVFFFISFHYISWYQSRLIVVQMSNLLNEQEALDGGSRENNVITHAEFRAFQHETHQTL